MSYEIPCRLLTCAGLVLLSATAFGQTIRTGAGNLTAVTTVRDQFRADLGGGNVAGPNGSFGGLRREINWDGVPDTVASPNNLPSNFFNVNSPRGVIFSTPGTGFQVSANSGIAPVQFDNINGTYSSLFEPFSAQRLFTSLGSNVLDVSFFDPGTNTSALTRGFGSVFSDVDLANTTSIEFFGAANNSLLVAFAPAVAGANETFSFIGAFYSVPTISRVRITNGNSALGAGIVETSQTDLVVMEDFLYATPTVVPEPGPIILALSLAVPGALALRRRHR